MQPETPALKHIREGPADAGGAAGEWCDGWQAHGVGVVDAAVAYALAERRGRRGRQHSVISRGWAAQGAA